LINPPLDEISIHVYGFSPE